MEERKIPFLVESENGHDEKLVPESKVSEETETQLKNGKWVTVEKKDGSTEMLTEPKEEPKVETVKTESELDEDKELVTLTKAKDTKVPEVKKEEVTSEAKIEKKPDEWKKSFGGDTKSVTATNKMKGAWEDI